MPKERAAEGLPASEDAFVLETCLRHIAVARRLPESFVPGTQVFQGQDAYRFLLEVACGLHSKMQGESEIFGQVKEGWKQFSESSREAAKPLNRIMQYLFTDTKRIRTQYLHGLGGQSYAGAVQKLLGLKDSESVLIVGAGQFGQMFAAKLRSRCKKVTVANRSPLPLHALVSKHPDIATLPGFEGVEEALHAADHVLICLPHGADEALETRLLKAWKKKKKGQLLHLGQMDFSATLWENAPRFLGLSDVMALQESQSKVRPEAIRKAFEAARMLTQERQHGVSLKSRLLKVA